MPSAKAGEKTAGSQGRRLSRIAEAISVSSGKQASAGTDTLLKTTGTIRAGYAFPRGMYPALLRPAIANALAAEIILMPNEVLVVDVMTAVAGKYQPDRAVDDVQRTGTQVDGIILVS